MRLTLRLRFALLSAVVLGLACGGDSSGPGITLQVSPAAVQLFRNSSAQLTVTALDSHGALVTGIAVTFTSNDTTVVTVTAVGAVQSGSKTGQTTVRVSGGGAVSDVPVSVTGIPTNITVTPADTLIRTTTSLQYRAVVLDELNDTMHAVTVTWASSDTSIASISAGGLANAKSRAGATLISASYGGRVGIATLRTGTPGVATDVTVTPADTVIFFGANVQLTASGHDAFGTPVPSGAFQWSSSNTTIATVSSTGLVHGRHGGQVDIAAGNGGTNGIGHVTVIDSLIVDRTSLDSRPQAAAIFGGIAYVTQLDAARVSRANLPSHAFSSYATVGSVPTGVGFNSTGSLLYVANQYSNSVSVVDVGTNAVIDAIPANARPFQVIVAPGDSIIYVAGIDSVRGIRLSDKTTVASFAIPDAGNGVAIARDSLLYVSTHGGGTIKEFNLRTQTVSRIFAVGGVPQKLVVSPNGNELWIANESGYVQFWNINTGLQIGSNLLLPSAGYGLGYRSSNGLLYASSAYFGGAQIYVINPVTRTLLYSTVVGGGTRDVVFTADGSMGIVANEGGWVDFLR